MISCLKMKFLQVLVLVALTVTASFAVPELHAVSESDAISIWVMNNGFGSQKALQRIVKKFYRDTGYRVSIRVMEWDEAFAEISRTLADQDSFAQIPDIVQLGSTWIAHFASLGQIRVVDSLVETLDSTRFFSESLKNSHIAGKPEFYSIPWFIDVRGMYANEYLWRSLNLSVADVADYSKFLGTLRVVAKANLKNRKGEPVAPFAMPGKDDWTSPQQMAPFIWSLGGDFISESAGKFRSALLDSNTLKGLALYAQMLEDRELAPNSLKENSAQNTSRFLQSQQLFLYGTSELIRQMEFSEEGGLKNTPIAEDGIMMVVPPVGSAGSASVLGGSHLALPAKMDPAKKKVAEAFLVYLFRADNLDNYSRHVGFLPADKSLIRVWNQDSRYSQFVKNLESARGLPNIPEWGSIESLMIGLSNSMGRALSEAGPAGGQNHQLARLIVDTHKQINEVLGFAENLDDSSAVQNVAKALSFRLEEITPKNLNIESAETSLDKNLVIAVLVGLLLVGLVAWFVLKQR